MKESWTERVSEALKHCYYQYICIKSVERVIGKQKDRNGCQKKKKTQKSRINVARSKSNLFIYHYHHRHHLHFHHHLCIFIWSSLMSLICFTVIDTYWSQWSFILLINILYFHPFKTFHCICTLAWLDQ